MGGELDIVEEKRYIKPDKGTDGSTFEPLYALTTFGQPIGLTEYCAQMANQSNVHVIQFYDWNSTNYAQIKLENLHKDEPFHELVLDERPGYKNLSLVK